MEEVMVGNQSPLRGNSQTPPCIVVENGLEGCLVPLSQVILKNIEKGPVPGCIAMMRSQLSFYYPISKEIFAWKRRKKIGP